MNLFSAVISLLVTLSSISAQAKEFYLLIDGNSMGFVTVESITDPEKVCYQVYGNGKECDGYTSANKLHKFLEDSSEAYQKLGLTKTVLQNQLISSEKISKLLRFNFMTEDGYVGFSQGTAYSWNSNSRYFDTTTPSDDILVMSPEVINQSKLSKEVKNHPSIGKSWREGNVKLTILSVFENELVEVGESYCSDDSNKGCSVGAYAYSLRKLKPIK